MKTILFLLLAIFFFDSCSSNNKRLPESIKAMEETDSTVYVKAKSFEGIIFKPTFKWHQSRIKGKQPILVAVPGTQETAWTPSLEAIVSYEEAFTKYWEQAKTDSLAKANNKVLIPYKRIDEFQRQYIGFIDSLGEKNIWVNLIYADSTYKGWKTQPILVDDGGPFKRNMMYNIDRDSIYNVRDN